MIRKFALWTFSIFMLTGCVEKEILDDIAIEMARAYDLNEEDKILGTSLTYNVQPDKSVENTTFSSIATTSRDLVNQLQKQSPEPIGEGSIEVFLFGKEIASKGLMDYLDAPQRNPSIGARVFLVVVDGKAEDVLKGDFGFRGNAIYISNLIEHNIDTEDVPKTNLQIFFHDYYQLGKTPYLPQIKKVSDNSLEVNGISLFKADKLKVIDTIEKDKMFYFKLLTDKYSKGSHKIKIGDEEGVIRSITSKHKMKLTKRSPYEVTVNLKIKGFLQEYTGKKLEPPKIKEIEKKIEEEITQECEAMIKRFQEKRIDPVGFGAFIKSKTRGFDADKWEDKEMYQSINVKVKTDVIIIESGVLE